jgi:hypothetical protein
MSKKTGYCDLLEFLYTVPEGEKFTTLNKWYEGGHWSKRKKLKDYYRAMFLPYFKDKQICISEFEAELSYNYNADVDNVITLLKIFIDNMRDFGIIDNDNTKIFKSLQIRYDSNLAKRSFLIKIKGLRKQ